MVCGYLLSEATSKEQSPIHRQAQTPRSAETGDIDKGWSCGIAPHLQSSIRLKSVETDFLKLGESDGSLAGKVPSAW